MVGIDNNDTVYDMRIALLVLDGVFDTGLAAFTDTLVTADALVPERRRKFSVTRVGLRRRVSTAQGLTVPVERIPQKAPDVVLVPALGAKTEHDLATALARPDVADAVALLGRWAARGTRVAGACTATFLLAMAGLLDGERATTSWWLAPAFRARFPAVHLDESRMIVEAKRAVTAGAALAHLDLALWLVRTKSPSLARSTARHLAFHRSPSQAAYVMPDHVKHTDAVVERFEAWVRAHLTTFSLAAAARAVGAGERTLERRIRRSLGKSPVAFMQDLRVEEAVHLLETTERSIEEIAAAVGYASGTTLRTLLRRKTGIGVRELRARADP
jgi:transcriptional regulator GlxA family with amidase domain